MDSEKSLTRALATLAMRPVARDALARARLHLLDWLGCVAGGRRAPVADVLARAGTQPVLRAAALGNVLEMDDVHRAAILHPGPVVWPAAVLAGCERSLGDVLAAAVAGYETMIRVGASFDAHHYAHFHPTATAGVFGAAAAAGLLLKLDEEQMVWALGNAGTMAAGLWQVRHEPVMSKQLHIMHAVKAGVEAARLAKAGFTGPAFILEGPQGLYAATCQAPKPEEITGRWPDWRMAEVSFKPWGACRHAHPAIDAALELKSRLGRLEGPIEVMTYRDALTFCDRPDPRTVHEAKFSLQHSVAIVAARGVPELSDFEPDSIAALAPVRARVTVREDPETTERYPAHYGARVSAGGDTVELVDTLGDPERPLSADEVTDKAKRLAAWGGLPQDAAEALVERAMEDDPGTPVARLIEQLP